mgnify:CR=1 FL=1
MEDFCLIQGDCMTNISQITGQVDMILQTLHISFQLEMGL